MRVMTTIILAGALTVATSAMAEELVVSRERAAAPPATEAPGPLIPKEESARDRANAEWAQNILDGKPNLSEEDRAAAAAQAGCLPASTKPFGEVRMAVGTGGYKSTGFTMVKPISGCGEIAVSADWTDGGRGFRRR